MAVGINDILQNHVFSPSETSFIHSTSVPIVFVTGALTHTGHELIQTLCSRGYRVHSISQSSRGCDFLRSLGCSQVTFGDELCSQTLQTAASGATLFVHCAYSHHLHCNDDAAEHPVTLSSSVNWHTQAVSAARSVVTVCRNLFVRRLVVLTSCTSPPSFRGQAPFPITEDTSSNSSPLGAHGRAMQAVEQLVIAANDPASLTTVIIRPRLLWGGQGDPLTRSLVAAARSRTLRLVDSGQACTSTCHVANACDAVVRALKNGPGGQVYFVSDGEPTTYRMFTRRVLQAAGVPDVDNVMKKSFPLAIARRVGRLFEWLSNFIHIDPPLTEAGVCLMAVPFVVCDDKARQMLGYRQVVSVHTGMLLLRKTLAMDGL